jgi:hypothetical protein
MEALSKITDFKFIAESCLRATMPDLLQTMELVKYGQQRVFKDSTDAGQVDSAETLELQEQLYFAKQKLETFGLLSSNCNVGDWQEFYRGDLLMELIPYLNEASFR